MVCCVLHFPIDSMLQTLAHSCWILCVVRQSISEVCNSCSGEHLCPQCWRGPEAPGVPPQWLGHRLLRAPGRAEEAEASHPGRGPELRATAHRHPQSKEVRLHGAVCAERSGKTPQYVMLFARLYRLIYIKKASQLLSLSPKCTFWTVEGRHTGGIYA